MTKRTSNFGIQFLNDFRLWFGIDILPDGTRSTSNDWVFSKKALERFHLPVTYRNNGPEDDKHYLLKSLVHDYIYDNYYLQNGCNFCVTTELVQKVNPFYSHLDGKIPVFFTMDICAIRLNDCQVFCVEIDGPEHYSRGGMMKADIRDTWLYDRYGVLTLRIDKSDDDINYKKIDKFISQPTVQNPRRRKKKIE